MFICTTNRNKATNVIKFIHSKYLSQTFTKYIEQDNDPNFSVDSIRSYRSREGFIYFPLCKICMQAVLLYTD